jgi:hypothetical protein
MRISKTINNAPNSKKVVNVDNMGVGVNNLVA